MSLHLVDAPGEEPVVITALTKTELPAWLETQEARVATWVATTGFHAEPENLLFVPDDRGQVVRVLFGIEDVRDIWCLSSLPRRLARGTYALDPSLLSQLKPESINRLCLGWALGAYEYSLYRATGAKPCASLVWPEAADRGQVEQTVRSIGLVRDLVNTPANDLGPRELAEVAESLAAEFAAEIEVKSGEVLEKEYPTIHAVGKGSDRKPCLIDMRWKGPESEGTAKRAKITVVGKGIVFDSGGLDLKPAAAMKLMKKDMGGAAHALGLSRMIMAASLPVELRLLLPVAENSVSGSAFRPNDVLRTRKGITVEVGNTDAEGRLVLCDALVDADAESPDLLVDFATLTGAARVALGPEIPAMFCNDDELAAELLACSDEARDPVWQLPLYRPYIKNMSSKIADTNNIADNGFAGAIIAGLFLQKFVSDSTPWIHLDVYAWNISDRPGRPSGGEAFSIRAVFNLIKQRFS